MIGRVVEDILITIRKGSIVDVIPNSKSSNPNYTLSANLTQSILVSVHTDGTKMKPNEGTVVIVNLGQVQILENLEALAACKIEEEQ
jgi:hypothetical protein